MSSISASLRRRDRKLQNSLELFEEDDRNRKAKVVRQDPGVRVRRIPMRIFTAENM